MILVNTVGTTNGSIQLSSCKTDIVKDSTYTVSFWMKGSLENLNFNAIASLGSAPFTSFYSNSFSTTSNWKEYCFSFSNDSTIIGDVRLLKIQFLDTGMYYLDYVTVNGSNYLCSTFSSVYVSILNKLEIFPNPSSGIININNLNSDFTKLIVSNINGSVISNIPIISLENITVDINQMDNGIYLLHFTNKKGLILTKKLIKN
jgi:hypothetical protein